VLLSGVAHWGRVVGEGDGRAPSQPTREASVTLMAVTPLRWPLLVGSAAQRPHILTTAAPVLSMCQSVEGRGDRPGTLRGSAEAGEGVQQGDAPSITASPQRAAPGLPEQRGLSVASVLSR